MALPFLYVRSVSLWLSWYWGRLDEELVNKAPSPVLARLEASNQRVAARMEMRCSMLAPRLVAASNVAAAEAEPEVNPFHPQLETFLASVRRVCSYRTNLIEMSAVSHGTPS